MSTPKKKINLAVGLAPEVFFEWFKIYAPELSSDAELKSITVNPDTNEMTVHTRTERDHTISYLKAHGKLKS